MLVGGGTCKKIHDNSEFYSNHSVYDVKITVPNEYVVGSGGLLISETPADEGAKALFVRAEYIVYFAWTAWPVYKVFTDFFFSSRRRHTIYIGDWSSDVCSSDLASGRALAGRRRARGRGR